MADRNLVRPDRIAFLIVLWVGAASAMVLVPMTQGDTSSTVVMPDVLAFDEGGGGLRVETTDQEEVGRRSSGSFDPETESVDDDEGSTGDVPSVTLNEATTTTTTIPTTTTTATTSPATISPATKGNETSPTTMPGGGDPATTDKPTGSSGVSWGSVVYENDFFGGQLDHGNWVLYNSTGHAGWGLRRPEAVSVEAIDGAGDGWGLQITAQMVDDPDGDGQVLVSGGMLTKGLAQTYGRYTIRMRVDGDPDQVTVPVLRLWPVSDRWPHDGEINIVDGWANRSTRTPVESTLHWADEQGAAAGHRIAHPVSADQWHTYTLEWRPDLVSLTVDGGGTQILAVDPDRIPHTPMSLVIQLDANDSPDAPGVAPVLASPVRLQIDSIFIEALPG